MPEIPPVVKWLLGLNLGIFLLDYLLIPLVTGIRVDDSNPPILLTWGSFSIDSGLKAKHLWELLTFQFMHFSLGHVAFNCIGLFFFGPWMERWWGATRFLIFYLLCGASGALFFTLLTIIGILPDSSTTQLVGASAGIYGILIGVAVIAPDMRVRLLLPPIELSMRKLAIGLMILSTGLILLKLGGNEGGEAGHLGGAMLGFLLMRIPQLLGKKSFDASFARLKPLPAPKLRPQSQLNLQDDPVVDAILEKISSDGFQSLTDSERATLRAAAERQQSNS